MTVDDVRPIRIDVPHSARIWNYWLGGKDNYEIDQIVGEASLAVDPEISTMAIESRRFLIRAVSYLAKEAGIRQFLDIGCGLPAVQNTHEVAQGIVPEAKIVYVDNDPLVLTHAGALLTSITNEGVTSCIDCDYHYPEQIVGEARKVLDVNEPVGVMFMGVLGYAKSYEDMLRIVRTVMGEVPSGSYLVLWDGTVDSNAYVRLWENYTDSGAVPYVPRPRGQIRAVFDGLELVEPGFVSITQWRNTDLEVGHTHPISAHGGVARKR